MEEKQTLALQISVNDLYLRDAEIVFRQFGLKSRVISHNSKIGYGESTTLIELVEDSPDSLDAFIKSEFFDKINQSFVFRKLKKTKAPNKNCLRIF